MKVLTLLCVMLLPTIGYGFDHGHVQWTQVLKKYQDKSGFIHYRQLKADMASPTHPLEAYLKDVQSVPLAEFEKWQDNQKKAFLINAYNALTVKLILDNYPVKSIKKIGGLFSKPWRIEFFSLLDGKIKALDPIEHEWLRPKYKDFRIHAAVNCASFSCPPLRNEAFTSDKLDAQLDSQMKSWLADSGRNRISKHKFEISKIFDWYKDDF